MITYPGKNKKEDTLFPHELMKLNVGHTILYRLASSTWRYRLLVFGPQKKIKTFKKKLKLAADDQLLLYNFYSFLP